MFGSVAIRAWRYAGGYKCAADRLGTLRNYIYFSHPIRADDERKLIDEVYDGTFAPLLDMLRNDDIVSRLVSGNPLLGRSLNADTTVRYCACCAMEQRRNFGVSWWERRLNLPFVTACPLHHVGLRLVRTNVALARMILPHEADVWAIPAISSVTETDVVRSSAVALLCEQSRRIDHHVFRCWVAEATPGVSSVRILAKHLAKNGPWHFTSLSDKELPCSAPDEQRHSGLTNGQPELLLAAFAAAVRHPEDVIDELVRHSSPPVIPPPRIKETALKNILTGYGEERARGGPGILQLVRKNIDRCLALGPYRDEGVTALAPLIVDFMLLAELAPQSAEHFRAQTTWESSIGVLTQDQIDLSWYFLDVILNPETPRHRYIALQSRAAAEPIVPAWRRSYLETLLRYRYRAGELTYKAERRYCLENYKRNMKRTLSESTQT